MEGNISVKDTSVNLQETFLDLYKQQKLRKYQKCQSNHNTVGISQYNPIQLAKYCNLIGWLRATELDYIVKCPQCKLQWLKKLSQCLAILKRLTCHKSNKIDNNLKIIYVILHHLGVQIRPRSCALDNN